MKWQGREERVVGGNGQCVNIDRIVDDRRGEGGEVYMASGGM